MRLRRETLRRVSVAMALLVTAVAHAAADSPPNGAITALGRLEPKDGILVVAGPAQPTVFMNVIQDLGVKEGDRVQAGQVIGTFDSHRSKQAAVAAIKAELVQAEREYRRIDRLFRTGVAAESERDDRSTRVEVLKAQQQYAAAELELSLIRAPVTGRVIKIHAYPGERVAIDGVLELGQTDAMYAIAEVYESDIGRVRTGQRATVTSPALDREVTGTVEYIGLKIGKMDVIDTDPAAKTDARVVEVKIRLDDSARVAPLTNLQVDVRITP